MQRLSLILSIMILVNIAFAQNSPHGDSLKLACEDCHNPNGWKLEKGTYLFDHNTNNFRLEGQHANLDCKSCHTSLVFNQAKSDCISCHTDMHEQTVGMDCARCHTPQSWIVPNISEIHDMTRFPLLGAHRTADCYGCHISSPSFLNFEPKGVECIDCHLSNYDQTQNPNHIDGNFSKDCTECHDLNAFSFSGVGIIHDFFPLNEGHSISDCFACHTEGTPFSNVSNDCISCHQDNYDATTNPNHSLADLSTNCSDCHTTSPGWKPASFSEHDPLYFPIYSGSHNGEWDKCEDCHPNPSAYSQFTCTDCHEHNQSDMDGEHNEVSGYLYQDAACFECHPTGDKEGFNHSSSNFPLTGAHTSTDCIQCHSEGYAGTPINCSDCHNNDYLNTTNPNHNSLGLSSACADCHSTNPGWKPAAFSEHDASYFPVYSGSHNGEWNSCLDCHLNPDNYSQFTCVDCHDHLQPEMDDKHSGVSGYVYQSLACFECHPDGQGDGFNHDASNFPLTGAHTTVDCQQCHVNGFGGTPTNCTDCHNNNYLESTNPNHNSLGLSNDCAVCHTTQPGWTPAAFPVHNDFYVLEGAHTSLTNGCVECHAGDYNNTPNSCFGCHEDTYNQTTNPNHVSVQFPTNCESCHSQTAWTPATFDHDGQYFPIYSGSHNGEWDACSDCHTTAGNYSLFSCTICHAQGEMNNEHQGISGYVWESNACFACHPDGGAASFDHNQSNFPLTGAHTSVACQDCHENGYAGTPTNCADCHDNNYLNTTNPNHNSLGLSNECAICHTTNPGWNPATFPNHNDYYVLQGAHASIANNCADCHAGNYNNTPNTCFGCHNDDYNQTNDPPHASAQFPTDCELCHTQNAWQPSTFNHDSQYFPIYSGEHNGEWNACTDCHTTPGNYNLFSCTVCHSQGEMNNEHQGISGYIYESNACYACHPDGSSNGFDHNQSNFPLTGAHTSVACQDCHENGYAGTPTNCADCHNNNYLNTTNPNHNTLGLSNDCAVCHSTNIGWTPASFPVHGDYYPLTGGHASISNDCAACHAGNYNTTSTNCSDCHNNNYQNTTNPNHNSLGLPTDCTICHTTNPNWNPATFPNHNDYYVLQGAHANISDNCYDCHAGNYNNTPNTCYGCHNTDYNQTNNPPHASAQFPTDCEFCHTQNAWQPSTFNHDSQYFPIYSGEHNGEWNACTDCHTTPGNYNLFSCTVCHSQGEMNGEHQGVSGYVYESTACYGCHPDGGSKKFNKIKNF